jgi:hypothetical protein
VQSILKYDVPKSVAQNVAENRAEGNQVPLCFNAHLQSAAAKEKEWKTYTWFFGRSLFNSLQDL